MAWSFSPCSSSREVDLMVMSHTGAVGLAKCGAVLLKEKARAKPIGRSRVLGAVDLLLGLI